MVRVLFVGNFLSRSRGTVNPSEKISERLRELGFSIIRSSSLQNTLLRLIDIVLCSGFRKYDVVHIDVFSGKAIWFAVCAAKLGFMRNKKVILNLHGGKLPEVYDQKKNTIHLLFSNASKIVTPSMYLNDFFSNVGFDIEYLPNPIDLKLFSYSWSQSKLNSKRILWVRSFSEIYRPLLAIDIFRQVLREFPEAKLTMIGPAGNQSEQVKDYILKNDIKNIDLLPPIPNSELPSIYSNHAIFLNTTMYESFGMGVVEAMACGIPVVTAKVGEIPYLWNNREDAFLVPGNDPILFSSRVVELFQQPDLAKSFSINARRKIERFSWESIRLKWESLFFGT